MNRRSFNFHEIDVHTHNNIIFFLPAPFTDDFNSEAAGRTFFRIFGCPKCPTCPTPVVCPTCPVCPAVAVVPAATITLSPLAASGIHVNV